MAKGTIAIVLLIGMAAVAPADLYAAPQERPDGPGVRQAETKPRIAFERRQEETPSKARPRPGLAMLEVVGINVLYEMIDHVVPVEHPEDYRISLRTWWTNLRSGFTWDNDPFVLNQAGHPYQGGNYFNAGRALGLNYWQSLPLATFGSLIWEYFGEATPPAWNDVVNTTLGGAAIGEALHRIAWLVRDPGQPGRARWLREIAAAGVDPITGLNRLASGAPRTGSRPRELEPDTLAADIVVGTAWQRSEDGAPFGNATPYGTFDIEYGRLEEGRVRAPFDAFTLNARVGGGAALSNASIKGRLAARSLGGGTHTTHQVVLLQAFDYQENRAVVSGGQSLVGGLADRFTLASGTTLTTTALAGVVLLGAVDSIANDPAYERPFDYGSGVKVSASAELTWRGHRVVQGSVSHTNLRTWTRVTADHAEARYSVTGRVPLVRGLHLTIELDALRRTSTSREIRQTRSWTQARAGLAWAFGK